MELAYLKLHQLYHNLKHLKKLDHHHLIQLYLVFEKLEDQSQMSRLKAIITKESPDSKFAHYLNDPQFFAKQEAQRLEMEQHYETTYSSYLMNDYSQTIAADQQMPNRDENPYVAKYRLIKAL